jgi:drug/metabolite transporter (DMT)-like permease
MSGVIWALIAGLTLGLFQLAHRRAGQEFDVHRGTFLLLLVSLFVLAGASLFSPDLDLLPTVSRVGWLNFALAGLVHFVGGWTLLSISQKKIGAARTGSLMGATPLFGTFLAFLLLGETVTLVETGGILMIVIGVILVSNG